MISSNDIIADFMWRVQQMHQQADIDDTDNLATATAHLERDLRAAWGGCNVYVPSRSSHDTKHERNSRIRAAWRMGSPITMLAERFNLSPRHIRRIISNRSPTLKR